MNVSTDVRQASSTPNGRTESMSLEQGHAPRFAGNSVVSAVLGTMLSLCFYAAVFLVPWQPLQRYFLGHPVAVAATILFWCAIAVLISKWLGVTAQSAQLAAIRDEDLLPPDDNNTPAGRWLQENDAGHVARHWLSALGQLPKATRQSLLFVRLSELLTRQSQRGTTKHMADDLRELSARDADAAHDSLGLVRIIVWAIPMLGFLGTVIGITQTLGGLDFSNGTAAVDNLKSGLYVAFDTTALGLVLSVIAIFAQFPVERSEQRLLAEIDTRVGHLVSSSLPSDEASDNQTALIADLCRGVQAAVAESLDNQARLWRETIDEAQHHWQAAHTENNNQISDAFDKTLKPALLDHAEALDESSRVAGDRLERQWERWQESISYHSEALVSQQQSLIKYFDWLDESQQRAESISLMQSSLDSNLQRLNETNAAIDNSVAAAAGNGMADAMRVLARAVDVLSGHLTRPSESGPEHATRGRRAA